MAIVYVGGKAYLVDREAYFLLCDLQKPELHETDGIKVFEVTLDWLQRFGKKAIKLEDGSPINFVPKFKKDEEP
jgi:hypothetical protein